jgi:hypothetical protein
LFGLLACCSGLGTSWDTLSTSTIKSCHDFSGALAGGIVELTNLERDASLMLH